MPTIIVPDIVSECFSKFIIEWLDNCSGREYVLMCFPESSLRVTLDG